MTNIRRIEARDIAPLLDIYNHYVLHSAATFDVSPVAREDQQEFFHHYSDRGPHRLLVATRGGRVAGYATSSPLRSRPAYNSSVEGRGRRKPR